MIEKLHNEGVLRDCRQSELSQSNGRASYYAARGYGSDQVSGLLSVAALLLSASTGDSHDARNK
jgi:hypothetical protein